jgi:2-haloacid dehalogenase
LNDGLKKGRLDGAFEAVLSTDRIRSYKPDPRAYRMAMDKLLLSREEILFVAFAGWDVAGAKWFGYPTFWLNRQASPTEELGVEADASGPDLNSLVQFVNDVAIGSE